ncbi:hypothetical protein [Scatolibacter rhodanostii]|uniref:hypothetical protein n=1 Tax=Scatolibacter rhodanostii TaxID=2014781 RepID=UPI000C080D5D|nr:hypothetical protein [Scatolibacter rhodanostii]
MTKELLENRWSIVAEIAELERGVSSSVQASSAVKPYQVHAVTIRGIPEDDKFMLLKLREQLAEIDTFIQRIPQSESRRIAKKRAAGMTFEQITNVLQLECHREGITVNSVQKKYYSLFK